MFGEVRARWIITLGYLASFSMRQLWGLKIGFWIPPCLLLVRALAHLCDISVLSLTWIRAWLVTSYGTVDRCSRYSRMQKPREKKIYCKDCFSFHLDFSPKDLNRCRRGRLIKHRCSQGHSCVLMLHKQNMGSRTLLSRGKKPDLISDVRFRLIKKIRDSPHLV